MLRRPVHPVLLLLVGLYALAGGYVHLQQWLDGYDSIPTSVAGWWVVRVGFIVSAIGSAVIAATLFAGIRYRSIGRLAVVGAVLFEAGSLGVLIATRMGSVFGWAEPVWTPGANQARAVAIGAITLGLVALAARSPLAPLAALRRRRPAAA